MLRAFVATLLTILVVATVAAAQTTTSTQTTTSNTSTTTTSNEGAFAKLSPGNQKIARALFEAQQRSGTSPTSTQPTTQTTSSTTTVPSGSSSTTSTTLSLDDIAAMKQSGKGWGEIFHEMKAQGLVQAKNLGQLVSQASRQDHDVQTTTAARTPTSTQSTTQTSSSNTALKSKPFRTKGPKDGTIITTGSGRSTLAGTKVKPEHGRPFSDSGQQSPSTNSGREFRGSDRSASHVSSGRSAHGGHGGRGKP